MNEKRKDVLFMYQNNYNGYYTPPLTQNKPMGLKGRPVSSLEEARAAAVDFDGSISYFPDLASNKIYTKQINVDGTASLKMYEFKEIPTVENSTYVTKKEFDSTLTEIKNYLAKLENTAAPASATKQNPAAAEMVAK